MRVFSRDDVVLAAGLLAAVVIVFHRPLASTLDVAHDVEERYQVELIPPLTVLTGVFAFHQYRKRQEARAAADTAAAQAEEQRARADELERLMTLGRALGHTLELSALQQMLWRHLPLFAGERETWILTHQKDRWLPVVRDLTAVSGRGLEELEVIATHALTAFTPRSRGDGLTVDNDVCFPMLAGGTVVGVLGLRNHPPLGPADRRAIGAAVTLIAIAIRNAQLLEDAREQGVRDSLTGCVTRGHGLATLQLELRRARRTRAQLSAIMIDIDQFKSINDRFGHLCGDEVLAAVGALITRTLRSTDIRCRYGGDEFLLVLLDTSLAGAQQIADRLRHAVAALEVKTAGSAVHITASVGAATALPGETDPTTLIARADDALYQAKRERPGLSGATMSGTKASAMDTVMTS